MGMARDLTMGPKRRKPAAGTTGPYAKLRRLVNMSIDDVDAAALKALIEEAGRQPGRMRAPEGRIYNQACARYKEMTGEQIGPETGTW